MRLLDSLHVSATGLSAQRTRVNLAASNLANAESTRGEGGVYRRQDPVFASVPEEEGGGVRVAGVARDSEPPRRVYLPSHPDADAEGFVELPNVDPITEVTNLIGAQRGFEANATAFETAKALAQRALDILR